MAIAAIIEAASQVNFPIKNNLTEIEALGLMAAVHNRYTEAGEAEGYEYTAECTLDDTASNFGWAIVEGNLACTAPEFWPGFEKYGCVDRFVLTEGHSVIAICQDHDENETWLRIE